MKNSIVTQLLLALGLLVAVSSCDTDDSDFNGFDHYIISFDLTVSGVTYQGAVTGDQIVMSVPEDVSLRNATVNVSLSENSTITPDPSGITDWSAEEQFVVTSYNNKRKSYIYRLDRTSVSTSGNVVLTTQAEVDAFADTGISVIDGNLIIGRKTGGVAADSILNLSGLGSLRQVVHNITIENTYAGKDLSGLENIGKIGGLKISMSPSLAEVNFPRLAVIGTSLSVSCVGVKEVKMPELTRVGETFLVRSDSLLAMDFGELSRVGGDMTFSGTNASGQKNRMGAISFPKLEEVNGGLTLSYWPAANRLDLPLLKNVDGMFTLSALNKIEEIRLPLLGQAGGLNLTSCAALAEFELPVVKSLNGNVSFTTLNGLKSLFVHALTRVEGNLTLGMGAATGVSFPELVSVSGKLSITAAASNLTAPYFPKLERIGGDLEIQSAGITDLTGFAALEEIGARLYLQNAGLTSLSDLTSLKKVGTSYYLYGLTNLTELDLRGVEVPEVSIYLSTWTGLTITGDEVFEGKINLAAPPSNLPAMPEITGIKTIGAFSVSTSSYTGPVEFGGIERVTGLLDFTSSNYTQTISMPHLKQAGGVKFGYNNSLVTVDFPELEEVTGYTDANGKELGDFNYPVTSGINHINLPKLRKVKGNFSVTGLSAARPLKGIDMPSIESVTGMVTLTGTNNANFVTVGNFGNLTFAGGVAVSGFTRLTSFEGFRNVIPALDESAWKVSGCGYNPTYRDMVDGQYGQP